jgi:hypothetical protein
MRGHVVKINSQDGISQRSGKPYTRWSFITKDESDNESGWVTYGFEKPPFVEGDLIEYEVAVNGRFKNFVAGSGKIIEKPSAPISAPRDTTKSGSSAGARPPGGKSDYEDRQQQIVLQHSQEMAIQTVATLLSNDSLPTTGAKTKAGEARRFEEIMAAIDKLTVKFYNDVVTGRLLSTVADMGVVDIKPDGQIPPDDTAIPKSEDY